MKKNKIVKIIFVASIFILLVLFLFFIIFVSEKVEGEHNYMNSIYGYWFLDTYDVYKDNKLISSEYNYKDLFIGFEDNHIEFCYTNDEGSNCFSHNYELNKKEIIIYLFRGSSKETVFTYRIVNNNLIIRDGDDSNYTLSTFSRR